MTENPPAVLLNLSSDAAGAATAMEDNVVSSSSSSRCTTVCQVCNMPTTKHIFYGGQV